jgi:hypothetical protein
MKCVIDSAKSFFKGVPFIGLSADCWTSRVGKGFIGIKISFVFIDLKMGDFL